MRPRAALLYFALAALPAFVSAEMTEMREKGGYRFINPLLECEGYAGEPQELRPFKYKLDELVQRQLQAKKVTLVSVYFRDLNNGPWFGIREKEDFTPASLLKVPIMMEYFKQAESDPQVLAEKIRYEGLEEDYDSNQMVRPKEFLEIGREYTVEELIRRMIVHSDNNATVLLYREGLLDRLYTDLGLLTPNMRKPLSQLSVKEYSSFFRILFNATYLNKAMSEKALTYLSQIDYNLGLVAGVPAGVAVAHKFGERNQEKEKQLHDSGIVYYPGHPYLICVMTRGKDFKELLRVIQEISRMVYKEVDAQYRKKN